MSTDTKPPTCPHGYQVGQTCPSTFCGDGNGTRVVTENDLLLPGRVWQARPEQPDLVEQLLADGRNFAICPCGFVTVCRDGEDITEAVDVHNCRLTQPRPTPPKSPVRWYDRLISGTAFVTTLWVVLHYIDRWTS